jgi:hypothetical protein
MEGGGVEFFVYSFFLFFYGESFCFPTALYYFCMVTLIYGRNLVRPSVPVANQIHRRLAFLGMIKIHESAARHRLSRPILPEGS